jgi:hypothetical protein
VLRFDENHPSQQTTPQLTKRIKYANIDDGRDVPETSLGGRGRVDGRVGESDTIERARVGGERGEQYCFYCDCDYESRI